MQEAKAALSLQVQELQREVQRLAAALQEAESLGSTLRLSLAGVQEGLSGLQEQHQQLEAKEAAVAQQVISLPTSPHVQ
jgi:chromosome segregation ATPase